MANPHRQQSWNHAKSHIQQSCGLAPYFRIGSARSETQLLPFELSSKLDQFETLLGMAMEALVDDEISDMEEMAIYHRGPPRPADFPQSRRRGDQ